MSALCASQQAFALAILPWRGALVCGHYTGWALTAAKDPNAEGDLLW